MPAYLVDGMGCPAVANQYSGAVGDNTDRVDGFLAALRMQELQGQRSIGDDVEPLGLLVDAHAGLVGMQGRACEQMFDGSPTKIGWESGNGDWVQASRPQRMGQSVDHVISHRPGMTGPASA